MAYCITTTYILWLFFGWLGIHHLYLGRLNHAIIWFATLGGGGVGWLRDLWRIPTYVKRATADDVYLIQYILRKESRRYPPCSFVKSIGMFVMGYLVAVVFSGLAPKLSQDDWRSSPHDYIRCSFTSKILYVIGAVTGIHLVANIGETRLRFDKTLKGCLLSLPLVILSGRLEGTVLFGGFTARFFGLRWRHLPGAAKDEMTANKKFSRDCIKYLLACLTWRGLICYGMFSHASVAVQVWPWPHVKIHAPSHEDMENVKLLNLLQYYINISRSYSNGTLNKSIYLTY